jgi:hypothetical protein
VSKTWLFSEKQQYWEFTCELSGISCKVSGQARGRVSDSGAIKKLAEFLIRNLVKLVKLDLVEHFSKQGKL